MDNTVAPRQVLADFDFGSPVTASRAYGHGLINDTYQVDTADGHQAILQRVNTEVFPHPEEILSNLRTLLDHVRAQASSGLQLPDLYVSVTGQDFVRDEHGGFWRALEFIPASRSLDRLTNAGQAREVGAALGRFHRLLHELPAGRLHTTLPGFHNAPEYLRHFDDILLDSAADHSVALRDAVLFVETRREQIPVLEQARLAGDLALRPTHGDPKLDNFLFDAGAQRVIGLIDLDTVQPGLVQVDVADCLRSCCNRSGEMPAEPYAVRFDLDAARLILHGYLEEAREFLTREDHAYLFEAIRLVPLELGLRFLTDHFAGDRYFKVSQPGQNLLRARVQFRLAADIERHEGALRHLIETVAAD